MLLQNTHSAVQYSRQAERFLDGIFSSLADDLRTRDSSRFPPLATLGDNKSESDTLSLLSSIRNLPSSSSSTAYTQPGESAGGIKAHDPIHMLRAIASIEGKDPREDVLNKAEQLESVPAYPSGLGSSIGPGAKGYTPRRITSGTTPRRM